MKFKDYIKLQGIEIPDCPICGEIEVREALDEEKVERFLDNIRDKYVKENKRGMPSYEMSKAIYDKFGKRDIDEGRILELIGMMVRETLEKD